MKDPLHLLHRLHRQENPPTRRLLSRKQPGERGELGVMGSCRTQANVTHVNWYEAVVVMGSAGPLPGLAPSLQNGVMLASSKPQREGHHEERTRV